MIPDTKYIVNSITRIILFIPRHNVILYIWILTTKDNATQGYKAALYLQSTDHKIKRTLYLYPTNNRHHDVII